MRRASRAAYVECRHDDIGGIAYADLRSDARALTGRPSSRRARPLLTDALSTHVLELVHGDVEGVDARSPQDVVAEGITPILAEAEAASEESKCTLLVRLAVTTGATRRSSRSTQSCSGCAAWALLSYEHDTPANYEMHAETETP